MLASGDRVTAAVLIIGDEILSGRTQDTNLAAIARYIGTYGVDLAEARVVGDIPEEIITALNHLRGRYDYVFTTGGIGPTHDDITVLEGFFKILCDKTANLLRFQVIRIVVACA